MTKKDLLKRLESISDDKVFIISDGDGWANIDKIEEQKCHVVIHMERHPIFSEN